MSFRTIDEVLCFSRGPALREVQLGFSKGRLKPTIATHFPQEKQQTEDIERYICTRLQGTEAIALSPTRTKKSTEWDMRDKSNAILSLSKRNDQEKGKNKNAFANCVGRVLRELCVSIDEIPLTGYAHDGENLIRSKGPLGNLWPAIPWKNSVKQKIALCDLRATGWLNWRFKQGGLSRNGDKNPVFYKRRPP